MKNIFKKHKILLFSCLGFQHINLFDVYSKSRIPQNAKSVILCIFPYYSKKATQGNISAYCAVKDYHIEVMKQLKSICVDLEKAYSNESFVPFVDASPIDEVDAAAKAGLGVIGKNSLLITKNYGSYVFIGEIVTTLKTENNFAPPKACMSCDSCQKACPGNAIENSKITKENCASHISQKKQDLTKQETEILKRAKTVFGCDICQEVCPHNKNLESTAQTNLFCEDIINTVTQKNAEQLYKNRAFGFRGLKVLTRNATIYEND